MQAHTIKDTCIVTSEQVMAWAKRNEVQQSYTALLDSFKETKDFDTTKSGRAEQKPKQNAKAQGKRIS